MDSLTEVDCMLLFCLLTMRKVNLPRLIFYYMIDATASKEEETEFASVPYGMFLTKVFEHLSYPLANEWFVYMVGIDYTISSFRAKRKFIRTPAEQFKRMRKAISNAKCSKENKMIINLDSSLEDSIKVQTDIDGENIPDLLSKPAESRTDQGSKIRGNKVQPSSFTKRKSSDDNIGSIVPETDFTLVDDSPPAYIKESQMLAPPPIPKLAQEKNQLSTGRPQP